MWGALAGLLLISACSFKASTDGDADVDLDERAGSELVQSSVRAALKALFPDLSDAELDSFATKLDVSSVVALKLEIEDLRALADRLSKELSDLAESSAREREEKLAPHGGGFPEQLTPIGLAAFYDAENQEGRVDLSAVFEGRQAVLLASGEVQVTVDGVLQSGTLQCASQGEPVDIVLLVDITGSMRPVIRAVRDSLLRFVEQVVASGVRGTLSVVTYQDSVGVDVSFQESRPPNRYERSPFLANVAIHDAEGVARLKSFLARLEADSGADRAENLAAAIDFANANTLGLDAQRRPNVLGDGQEDPAGVRAFPALANPRRVFAAFTDAPFHSDSRTPDNSSLLKPFKPRPIADILASLQKRGTTVHVCDPSWVDLTVAPTGVGSESEVDSDYWAIQTGGVGEDRTLGYALNDLDQLILARDTGLLDVILDGTVASTCTFRFARASLAADARFELTLQHGSSAFHKSLTPTRL